MLGDSVVQQKCKHTSTSSDKNGDYHHSSGQEWIWRFKPMIYRFRVVVSRFSTGRKLSDLNLQFPGCSESCFSSQLREVEASHWTCCVQNMQNTTSLQTVKILCSLEMRCLYFVIIWMNSIQFLHVSRYFQMKTSKHRKFATRVGSPGHRVTMLPSAAAVSCCWEAEKNDQQWKDGYTYNGQNEVTKNVGKTMS